MRATLECAAGDADLRHDAFALCIVNSAARESRADNGVGCAGAIVVLMQSVAMLKRHCFRAISTRQ